MWLNPQETADLITEEILHGKLPGSTVVMQNDDIDSLVIALGCKHFVSTLEIWLEAGMESKNNLQFTNFKTWWNFIQGTPTISRIDRMRLYSIVIHKR